MSGRDASKGRGWTETSVFGRRTVMDALESERTDVQRVVMDARSVPKEARARIKGACRDREVVCEEGTSADVASLSQDSRNDQGVAARVRLTNVIDVPEFIDTLKGAGARHPARVLALDGVTNPQNVGMVIRSVVASGMRALLWPTVGCPWITGLVIKASAGTLFRCSIVRCGSLHEGISAMRDGGFRVFALEAGAGGDLFSFEAPHRSVFVVGGEIAGISADVQTQIDERISIPMANDVESLNAAIAASLLCFQVGRVARS